MPLDRFLTITSYWCVHYVLKVSKPVSHTTYMSVFTSSDSVTWPIAVWELPSVPEFTSTMTLLMPASWETLSAIDLLTCIALQKYGMQHDAPIQEEQLALTNASITGLLPCKLSGIASILTRRFLTNRSSITRMHTLACEQLSGVHLIPLWINTREFQLLVLVGPVGVLGSIDPGVTGFCQDTKTFVEDSVPADRARGRQCLVVTPGLSRFSVETATAQRTSSSIVPELGRPDYQFDLLHSVEQGPRGLRCVARHQLRLGASNGAIGSIPKSITQMGLL